MDSCPGHQFTRHETISKGDKVLIRWTFTGIAKKDFLGVWPYEIIMYSQLYY
ncbi:MAG: hypothetical protein ACJ71K_21180 [Nitrososphaeraceae archaeon]|jgi:hypothetical protein